MYSQTLIIQTSVYWTHDYKDYFSDPQKVNIREIYSHTYGKHEFVCSDQVFPLLFVLILLITSNKKKILKYYYFNNMVKVETKNLVISIHVFDYQGSWTIFTPVLLDSDNQGSTVTSSLL